MSTTFVSMVNAALHKALQIDETVLTYGLGINDPGKIHGSTVGLLEAFGPDRVFDMPTSENAMAGVGVGLAIDGFRPIYQHNRIDFILLAMDQIINSAAKWHSLFAGTMSVPLTIRTIVGRGWGQGPTHCQSLQSCFVQIPGLKVVMPSLAEDVYGLLLSSIFDDNPVLFIEHRWLQNIRCNENENPKKFTPLGKAKRVTEGSDITIVSMSYATIEALHAVRVLKESGIHCELIDLRTIKPLDWDTVYASVNKTGKLLVLDTGFEFCSVATDIVARVSMHCFDRLSSPAKFLAMGDYSVLTSPSLTVPMYTYSSDIVREVLNILNKPEAVDIAAMEAERDQFPRDIPGDWFKGPF